MGNVEIESRRWEEKLQVSKRYFAEEGRISMILYDNCPPTESNDRAYKKR